MKYILFILLTLIITSQAQELRKVTKYYDKESTVLKEEFFYNNKLKAPDSLYTSYYHNGNIKAQGFYKNGKIVGIWNYFYENGKLKASGLYVNNLQNDEWKYYYENGQLSMQGKMHDGKKDGAWRTFYENSVLKAEGNYYNGKQDGNWTYYTENGERKGSAKLDNGNGAYTEYYENGNVKVKGHIKNGVSDSLWTYYYSDGSKKAEGNEKNGQKSGQWKTFHENGIVSENGVYKEGKAVGKWTYFHKNGQISSEGNHDDGKKDGKWTYYYDTGALKGESEFAPSGDGQYKEYYPSGKLKAKGELKNATNHGHWEYFYESGEKEGEAEYENGAGKYIGYHPSGTKKMEGDVNNGMKIGTWSLYDKEGVLMGLYRHFNGDEIPVAYDDAEEADSSTLEEDTSEEKYIPLPKERPKTTYTRFKPNIYKSFIVGFNPTAVIISQLPIYLEYYIEKRKGFEIQYTSMRNPFFGKHNMPKNNQQYTNGYSITFKNKFYKNPKVNKGMWYISYDVRYINVNESINLMDSAVNTFNQQTELLRKTSGFEATAQFGDRFIKKLDKPGMTLDFFLGIGLGYKYTVRKYDNENFNDTRFKTKISQGFYLPLRLGFSIGYLF